MSKSHPNPPLASKLHVHWDKPVGLVTIKFDTLSEIVCYLWCVCETIRVICCQVLKQRHNLVAVFWPCVRIALQLAMIFRQGVWISIRDFDQESICGGISYCDLAISSKTLNYVLSISPEVGVIGGG